MDELCALNDVFWIIFTTFAKNYHRRDETKAIYHHTFFTADSLHNHDVGRSEQTVLGGA